MTGYRDRPDSARSVCSKLAPSTPQCLALAIAALPAFLTAFDRAPAAGPDCQARGSREWLATRPSPLDSVTLVIGTSRATICYSRPSARGRQVLDSLLPYGKTWRTGANEPTVLELSDSMEVAGVRLPAGRFVILTVPQPDAWAVVFNTTPATEPAEMFASLTQVGIGRAAVEPMDTPIDRFTIRTDSTGEGGEFLLEWERFRVRIPVRALSRRI